MLLNLASASNAHERGVLWGFILRHVAGVTPESHPKLDELVGYAVRYYRDFVEPTKVEVSQGLEKMTSDDKRKRLDVLLAKARERATARANGANGNGHASGANGANGSGDHGLN